MNPLVIQFNCPDQKLEVTYLFYFSLFPYMGTNKKTECDKYDVSQKWLSTVKAVNYQSVKCYTPSSHVTVAKDQGQGSTFSKYCSWKVP